MAITIRAQYARTRDRLSQQIFAFRDAPVTKQNQTGEKKNVRPFLGVQESQTTMPVD